MRECTDYFDDQFRNYMTDWYRRHFKTRTMRFFFWLCRDRLWNLLYDAAQGGFQIGENWNNHSK